MTQASAERAQLPAEIPLFPLNLVLFPDGVLQLKLPKKAKDVPSARQIAIQ